MQAIFKKTVHFPAGYVIIKKKWEGGSFMNKLLKIAVAFLLCAVLCASSVSACEMYPIRDIEPVGTTVEIKEETDDSVTLRKTGDGPFKILMFTDIHLATLDKKQPLKDRKVTIEKMIQNIRREKPDLVLLGGDNVTSSFNLGRTHQLARIFEKLGVYWGGILGNHEGDNLFSIRRSTMVKVFSAYDHCLMRQGLKDVDGDCNYVIRILNDDGSLKQAVFCFDSFDGMPAKDAKAHGLDPADKPYDVIKQSQIDWYKSQVDAVKKEFGKCPSFALLHVPLTQFKDALAQVNDGKMQFLWGESHEGVSAAGYDSGLFDAIKASQCTTHIFAGHDHINTFGVKYDGVILSYIEPSGYGAYDMYSKFGSPEEEWLEGYTRLTLADDGTFTHEQFRNSALPA